MKPEDVLAKALSVAMLVEADLAEVAAWDRLNAQYNTTREWNQRYMDYAEARERRYVAVADYLALGDTKTRTQKDTP
jgi:hypothetical protein